MMCGMSRREVSCQGYACTVKMIEVRGDGEKERYGWSPEDVYLTCLRYRMVR